MDTNSGHKHFARVKNICNTETLQMIDGIKQHVYTR